MEYFFSHIGYIVAVAVILGLVGFATVVMASKNEANRVINEEKCNFHCGSCPNTEICHKEGKKTDVL